jgi:hypothetical protein
MVWKPNKTLGLIVGLVILLTIIGVDVFLVRSIVGRSLDLNLYFTSLLLVLSLPLAGLWIFWYLGLLTLHYHLDRNALSITCGTSRQIVPMGAIQRIVPGSEVRVARGFKGVGWPGYLHGTVQLEGLGMLLTSSTEPLEHQLVVVTNSWCYGISPRNTQQFLEDLAARRSLGPIREYAQAMETTAFAALRVWRDRWFWGIIVLAFAANAVLFGLVSRLYAYLPERMPLHFDALGQVDRIAAKSGILVIPGIGMLTLAVNGLLSLLIYQRERLGAYLLAVIALAVQAISWLAAISILNW